MAGWHWTCYSDLQYITGFTNFTHLHIWPKSVHSILQIPLPRRHSSRRWGPTKLGDAGNATFPNGELGMVQMAWGSHITMISYDIHDLRGCSCGWNTWDKIEYQPLLGLATDLAGAQCSTAAVHIQKRPVERIGPHGTWNVMVSYRCQCVNHWNSIWSIIEAGVKLRRQRCYTEDIKSIIESSINWCHWC